MTNSKYIVSEENMAELYQRVAKLGNAQDPHEALAQCFLAFDTLKKIVALIPKPEPAESIAAKGRTQMTNDTINLLEEALSRLQAITPMNNEQIIISEGAILKNRLIVQQIEAHLAQLKASGRNQEPGEIEFWIVDAMAWGLGLNRDATNEEKIKLGRVLIDKYPQASGPSDGELNSQRYEYIRRLRPREFEILWMKNLQGEGTFDQLVDAAIQTEEKIL